MKRRVFLSLLAGSVALSHRAQALPVPPAPRRLRLVNAHTGETFSGIYRDAAGPIPRVLEELSIFLRDHHSGEKTEMDVGVLDFLGAVMEAAGQPSATILSAYRTPETNAMLARTTFGVAENSQHLYGRALDVHFGAQLADAMTAARAMKRGGVGWYPHSGFIHIDTGPVRSWDLDEGGLGNLLFGTQRISFDTKGELLVSGPARLIIGGGKAPLVLSGRPAPSVRQRLGRLRLLAKAEMVARRR
ncbi:MAG: DUF882 domain-containing protein [Alphaproteobacteria bacterium]|nr:DUF882 domain-containing protein [Alphaproteobacteria bacterium]MBV9862131.1 DUF882 domain-containing protein [Alphaproteobacteria bacterium]